MFKQILFDFIKSYDCNPKLLEIIYKCKDNLKKSGIFPEPVRIETSIKTFKNGNILKKRYGVSIYLSEFLKYKKEDIKELLNFLNFDFSDIPQIDNCERIYFALDNNKGKIYVSNTMKMICKENDGRIKYYSIRKDKPNWMNVFSNDSVIPDAINVRIENKNEINWYTISKNFKTKYYRPYINFEKNVINSLNDNDKNTYLFYKHWYYHYCMCSNCFGKDFLKNLNKSNIELLIEAENSLNNDK
jgi:hypothetical protein